MGANAATAFLAFTLAAALLTVTPGLDTVLVMRTWLSEGRGAAMRAVWGVQAGCFAWGLAVAVGRGGVLAVTPQALGALRLVGAAYLLVTGTTLLLRRKTPTIETTPRPPAGPAFRRGLLTNLLNPKVGLFYLSFLPGFVPAGWPPGPTMVCLTLIHVALAVGWFALLLGGGGAVREALIARAGIARTLDRITGLVFVGFGLRLALDRS